MKPYRKNLCLPGTAAPLALSPVPTSGVVSYLNLFLTNFYAEICRKDYGKTIGEINRDALRDMFNNSGDYYSRMHAEQITLHGDPAVYLHGSDRPDYVMEESGIRITPSFISVAESTFKLKVRMVNIGKAIKDSVMIEVRRQLPDNSYQTLYHEKRRGIMWSDSLTFDVPIVATRDKGRNRIYVTIDSDNTTSETDENNNAVYKEFFIYDEEARPAYPFNLGIVHDPATKFYASTANPFSQLRQYVMEMDTTQLFNSKPQNIQNHLRFGRCAGIRFLAPVTWIVPYTTGVCPPCHLRKITSINGIVHPSHIWQGPIPVSVRITIISTSNQHR